MPCGNHTEQLPMGHVLRGIGILGSGNVSSLKSRSKRLDIEGPEMGARSSPVHCLDCDVST